MYHDTIHINLKSVTISDIQFDYSFLISKNHQNMFSPVKYNNLLEMFSNIGFDLKYIKFYDIEDDTTVYCTYNYQPNFEIFFKAYSKTISNKHFGLTFEYGNIINGKFYANNINLFAGVAFYPVINPLIGDDTEVIIKYHHHEKISEFYQIVDKNGQSIHNLYVSKINNFEQDFFDRYEVKVYIRKYKLRRLNDIFE